MTTVEHIARKLRQLPPELLDDVETFVEFLLHKQDRQLKVSALEVLAGTPEERAFSTADEVREYLQAERDSWER
jgi:hypothetical protein